jgi:hypothetical protein
MTRNRVAYQSRSLPRETAIQAEASERPTTRIPALAG